MTLVRRYPSAGFQPLRFNDLLFYNWNSEKQNKKKTMKQIYNLSAKLTHSYYSPISLSLFQLGQGRCDFY